MLRVPLQVPRQLFEWICHRAGRGGWRDRADGDKDAHGNEDEPGETGDDRPGGREFVAEGVSGTDRDPEGRQKLPGRHSDHDKHRGNDQNRNDRINDDIRRQPDAADPYRQGKRPEYDRDQHECHG